MSYVIYSKQDCPSCVEAKQLLESKNIDFEYKVLNKDFTILELYNNVPKSCRSFPAIVKDGEYIGGLKELKNTLSKG